MNHLEAEKTKATERYLLAEMSDDERKAFEDHYLDCAICLEAVTFGVDFLDAGRDLAEQHAFASASAVPERKSWFASFRPLWQPVPAMAMAAVVCLAIAGYEAILLQRMKSAGTEKVASLEYRYILTGIAHGSGDQKRIVVPKGAIISVGVEYNPRGEFVSYQAQVVDQAGTTRVAVELPTDQTGNMASIALRTQVLAPGSYTTTILGRRDNGTEEQIGQGSFELIYK